MIQIVIAALILWALVTGLRWAAHADPKTIVANVKRGVGGALVLGAGFMLLARGNPEAAAGAGALGLWLIGWRKAAPAFVRQFFGSTLQSGAPRVLRSSMMELTIDPRRGSVSGRVLAGPYSGRALDEMDREELAALAEICRRGDLDGARLLEFYLDRRFSRRGDAGDPHAHAGWEQGPSAATMTEDHAYDLLGLQKSASREEIARAHRALMKKVHPDHGGTASLAALLNEARDVLMRRHQ